MTQRDVVCSRFSRQVRVPICYISYLGALKCYLSEEASLTGLWICQERIQVVCLKEVLIKPK